MLGHWPPAGLGLSATSLDAIRQDADPAGLDLEGDALVLVGILPFVAHGAAFDQHAHAFLVQRLPVLGIAVPQFHRRPEAATVLIRRRPWSGRGCRNKRSGAAACGVRCCRWGTRGSPAWNRCCPRRKKCVLMLHSLGLKNPRHAHRCPWARRTRRIDCLGSGPSCWRTSRAWRAMLCSQADLHVQHDALQLHRIEVVDQRGRCRGSWQAASPTGHAHGRAVEVAPAQKGRPCASPSAGPVARRAG
jgi:hypothetical protein